MTNSAAGGASDYNTEIIKEFRANHRRVGGMWTGTTLILIHHLGAKPGSSGSRWWPAPPGRRPVRDLGRQRRIAHRPELVLQPQGPPQHHCRREHPDVHGPGGEAGRHRPRRAVAKAGRGVAEAGRGVPDLGAAQAGTTRSATTRRRFASPASPNAGELRAALGLDRT